MSHSQSIPSESHEVPDYILPFSEVSHAPFQISLAKFCVIYAYEKYGNVKIKCLGQCLFCVCVPLTFDKNVCVFSPCASKE